MENKDKRLDPDAWGADRSENVIIGNSILPLLNRDRDRSVSTLLYGTQAVLYAQDGDWSLLAGAHDGYLGWAKNAEILPENRSPKARICALSTHLYPQADMKTLPLKWLPMGAVIDVLGEDGAYTQTPNGYVYSAHLQGGLEGELDAAGFAERFLEVPYLWGGGSAQGIDCSGLVQIAYAMAGVPIPRDSDQQEEAFLQVERQDAKRGDLVFWKGHVGILQDPNTMIHATAFVMKTIAENLDKSIARIGEPTSIRRVVG